MTTAGENDDLCPASLHVAPMLAELDERVIEATTTQIATVDLGALVLHDQDSARAALPTDDPAGKDTVSAILQAIDAQ